MASEARPKRMGQAGEARGRSAHEGYCEEPPGAQAQDLTVDGYRKVRTSSHKCQRWEDVSKLGYLPCRHLVSCSTAHVACGMLVCQTKMDRKVPPSKPERTTNSASAWQFFTLLKMDGSKLLPLLLNSEVILVARHCWQQNPKPKTSLLCRREKKP